MVRARAWSDGASECKQEKSHQFTHEGARRKVCLQERHQVSSWKHERANKYDSSRLRTYSLAEGVETGCRQNKPTNIRHVRQSQHSERYSSLPALFDSKESDRLFQGRLLLFWILSLGGARGVLLEVLMIEGAEVVGIFSLVFLDICLVHPAKGVHEPEHISTCRHVLAIGYRHVIQGWCDVTHHGHKEEGYL